MKTLIAVAVMALSVLSFSANASSKDTLLEAALAYKNDTPNYTSQGYFMGMVTMAAEAGDNCIPEGLQLKYVFSKVASAVLLDAKINSMERPSDMVIYAIHKSYPCTKS